MHRVPESNETGCRLNDTFVVVHSIQKIKSFFELSYGEFDPGSELTLVACLSHASRTRKSSSEGE